MYAARPTAPGASSRQPVPGPYFQVNSRHYQRGSRIAPSILADSERMLCTVLIRWSRPIRFWCWLRACSASRMLAGGLALSKTGPIGLDHPSELSPMRLRSAITAGTDPAARLPPVAWFPRRETCARPADSIRTFVAHCYPGPCLSARGWTRVKGRPPPDRAQGSHAKVYWRYTGGTCVLWPAGTWPEITDGGRRRRREVGRMRPRGPRRAWSRGAALSSAVRAAGRPTVPCRRDSSQDRPEHMPGRPGPPSLSTCAPAVPPRPDSRRAGNPPGAGHPS